jgi:U3 small nucleolar RNA-associated protein 21
MGIFAPFRAIGYITSSIPIEIQSRGQQYFLTTSIGSTFQILDGEKLQLLFVGDSLNQTIKAVSSYKVRFD